MRMAATLIVFSQAGMWTMLQPTEVGLPTGNTSCFQQLAGWFNDTTTWPSDRSFDVFRHWFDYQHHSMLIDLCDEPLIHRAQMLVRNFLGLK
jgi:hypothetical protein